MARSGVLPALSHLSSSGDSERQIHAIAAMANIAEMVEGRTQKRMIEEGCVKHLLRLADSLDVRTLTITILNFVVRRKHIYIHTREFSKVTIKVHS